MRSIRIIFIITTLSISACSSASIYDTTSGLRYSECRKIVDPDERDHCFRTADLPFEQYQKLKESE